MKKRTLQEELLRIHTITYGKGVINEENIIDKLLNFIKPDQSTLKKIDDPLKADFVTDDIKDFYDTLESIDTPLVQQQFGSMVFQKEVETVQIGLILLGYDLPKFGVDGYFGPETANVVSKFKKDNSILSESSSTFSPSGNIKINSGVDTDIDDSLQSKINAISSEYGKPFTITSGYRDPEHNQEVGGVSKSQHLDHNAVDIGLNDKSIESTLNFVSISSKNGITGIGIYRPGVLHIDIGPRRAWGPSKGRDTVPSWAEPTIQDHLNNKISGGYVPTAGTSTVPEKGNIGKESITPEMVKVMIDKLKQKNITSTELKPYIDTVVSGGSDIFTDLDLHTEDGVKKYAEICERFIRRRNASTSITGQMMADSAKKSFDKYGKYLPPELACGQLATEGGLSSNPLAKPIRTNNPFDIGNTDDGGTIVYPSVSMGIDAYYDLVCRRYLGKGKTAADLLKNFVNHEGSRYAGAKNYEDMVGRIAHEANKIAKTVMA